MKDHWAMILFVMEKLHQQYDVIMKMSYIELNKLIQIYLKLYPNKKREKNKKVNRIKQDFDPVKVFGWKSQ